MKRFITLFTLALIAGMVILYGCADPLEPTGPNNSDPTYFVDTVRDIDTFVSLDTTVRVDTVILIDSVCSGDTILIIDTVTIVDTLMDSDTIVQIDTATVIDTIIDIDTLTEVDTVILLDTITGVDTVIVVDTVIQTDTVTMIDTVVQVETVIVVVPDTSKEPLCGVLSKNQKEIVWILKQPAGNFRLEFLADVESAQPNQTLTVEIGDQSYIWDPNANPNFVVEQWLADRTTIRISNNIPCARGHAINVCLNVTRL